MRHQRYQKQQIELKCTILFWIKLVYTNRGGGLQWGELDLQQQSNRIQQSTKQMRTLCWWTLIALLNCFSTTKNHRVNFTIQHNIQLRIPMLSIIHSRHKEEDKIALPFFSWSLVATTLGFSETHERQQQHRNKIPTNLEEGFSSSNWKKRRFETS